MSFQNWHEEFDKFWQEHSKVWKIWTSMGSFWKKYIMFELKKDRGVLFHDTEKWFKTWGKTNLPFGKWHEEFGKFLPEHSKVSKLGLLWDAFIRSKICMNLKFTGELCIMKMKNYLKLEEKLTCRFKIDMRNLKNFAPSTQKSKNLHFNGLVLNKVYSGWTKKVQRSDFSLHWRGIQSLKKNWIVVWKMTWGILQKFTRALESLKVGTLKKTAKVEDIWAEEISEKEWLLLKN